jgi:hypothetical protein
LFFFLYFFSFQPTPTSFLFNFYFFAILIKVSIIANNNSDAVAFEARNRVAYDLIDIAARLNQLNEEFSDSGT